MDAVTLLRSDHRTVDGLFQRYESLGGGATEEKKEIFQEIIRELSIHAAIEEQVLYPGVKDALPDGDSLAQEALGEHKEVKEVLAELDRMDPSDSAFDPKVRSLIGDIRHHVEEEEGEMFPKLASALSQEDLEKLGQRMEIAKMAAPTRPHPRAPATPPANLVAGPMAAIVDRARDAMSGRAPKKPSAKKPSAKGPAKKAGAKRPAGRKTTSRKGTAKRASARKTSAKKSTARKSTARGPVIHVTASNGGWRAGARGSRAVATGSRKQDVIRRARDVAKKRSGRLVIHKENGRIQEERTYGADPRRSRG